MRARTWLGCIAVGLGLGVAGCVGDSSVTPAPDASQPDSGCTGAACADGSVLDGATDVSADAPPGFTPKSLPGLALWLEGSLGLDTAGSKVTKWHDQSGNGNDATAASNSAGPLTGLLVSKPALQFNQDSRLELKDAASLQWGTGDFLLEIVIAYSNPIPDAGYVYGEFYFKQLNASPFPGVVFLGNNSLDKTARIGVGLDDSTSVFSSASNLNDGTPRLVGTRRKGTTLEIRLNGVVAGTVTNAGVARDVSAIGRDVAIGGQIGLTALKGAVAEVIAIKGATSDTELATLEAYATKKYGL